jgi:hypothetical protein
MEGAAHWLSAQHAGQTVAFSLSVCVAGCKKLLIQ